MLISSAWVLIQQRYILHSNVITDGSFALCSTRIFLVSGSDLTCSARLISCGNKLCMSPEQDRVRLRSKVQDFQLAVRAQLLHLLAKQTSERKPWVPATTSPLSRAFHLLRSAIATRSPLLSAASLHFDLPQSPSCRRPCCKAFRCRQRSKHPVASRPNVASRPYVCSFSTRGLAPSSTTTLHPRQSFINNIDHLVILHSYCDNPSTVLGRLVRSLLKP
jgi:hypothetical protein